MSQVKDSLIELIKSAGDDYINDLQHLTTEQLQLCPGGSARKAADFSYEVAVVNKRIAARLRGEEPGPWAFEGWVTAPEEFQDQEALIKVVSDSVTEVAEALADLDDDRLFESYKVGEQESTLYKLASMCLIHTCYHDAQLNYLQSLQGDMEIHWK